MNLIRVQNLTASTILAEDLRFANTFWSRLKGLLGTSCLPPGQGLLITPCNSIHMFGMRYAIDVIFLDHTLQVMKLLHTFPPGKMACCPGSAHVLELPAGILTTTCTSIGDQLCIT